VRLSRQPRTPTAAPRRSGIPEGGEGGRRVSDEDTLSRSLNMAMRQEVGRCWAGESRVVLTGCHGGCRASGYRWVRVGPFFRTERCPRTSERDP
jgi:hypothetical protein